MFTIRKSLYTNYNVPSQNQNLKISSHSEQFMGVGAIGECPPSGNFINKINLWHYYFIFLMEIVSISNCRKYTQKNISKYWPARVLVCRNALTCESDNPVRSEMTVSIIYSSYMILYWHCRTNTPMNSQKLDLNFFHWGPAMVSG